MKHYILFLVLALSATLVHAQNENSKLIIGKWLNYDKTEITQITFADGVYSGNIVWLRQPNDEKGKPIIDSKNPNKKLRNKVILGSQNLFGLQYKQGKWQNGSIYSHKRGGTINFKVLSVSQTELIIKISKFFFSKEIIYTREL